MIQIELYVRDIPAVQELLTSVFQCEVYLEKTGFVHLKYQDIYTLMLCDPSICPEGVFHWDVSGEAECGRGVEIVLCIDSGLDDKHRMIEQMGYVCSDIRETEWQTREFVFHLHEGYLLRIKQPILSLE